MINTRHAKTDRARSLRQQQTKAESLLWQVLRAKRFCGLKFRRQHAIGPFFADFACPESKCVIELDGGYHDHIYDDDVSRQEYLEAEGWKVLRFSNEDVLDDVESVAVAIARKLGLQWSPRPSGERGIQDEKCQKRNKPKSK